MSDPSVHIQHGDPADDDDDHLDGCEIDFAEHAVSDYGADMSALFPPDQTDDERDELVGALTYLEELDA